MSTFPSLDINISYAETAANVVTSDLIPTVIGLNRQEVYRASASNDTFTGGLSSVTYEFPGLISGSTVESASATLDIAGHTTVLQPKVEISTPDYGVATIDDAYLTYSLSASPPTFQVSHLAQIDFTLSSGTSGALTNTGTYPSQIFTFTDTAVNFVTDLVQATDKIYIKNSAGSYIYEMDVAHNDGSGTALTVSKRNKSEDIATPEADLTINDANGWRTLTAASQKFSTNNVQKGDYVYLRGHTKLIIERGGDFTAEDLSGDRALSDPQAEFTSLGITTATNTYMVWGELSDGGALHPLFYVDSDPTVDTSMTVVNADGATPYPLAAATGDDIAYDIRDYGTAKVDLDGAGPPAATYLSDGVYGIDGDALGSGATVGASQKAFTSVLADFTVAVSAGDVIVIDNGAGTGDLTQGNYPAFVVDSIHDANTLVVSSINTSKIGASDTAVTVDFSIYSESTIATSQNSAQYGAAGSGVTGTERLFTSNDVSIDYASDGVAIGDIIKDRDGVATFYVRGVGVAAGLNAYELSVEDIPTISSTDEYFEYYIVDVSSTTDAKMEVLEVTSEVELICKNTDGTSPSTTTAFYDLVIPTIVYKDAATVLDYTIGHIASGSDLTGSILVSYTAKRNDSLGELITVNADNRVATVGYGTPANPMGLACAIVSEIYEDNFYAIQVEDDTLASWQAALNVADQYSCGQITVCSNTETVIQAAITQMKTSGEENLQIGFVNHTEIIQADRVDGDTYPGAVTFTKDLVAGTTNITITSVDASEYGAVVGDVFYGTWSGGASTGTLTALRVMSIQGATPGDGNCIIRIADTNGITEGSGTITDWSIKSKSKTLAERAAALKAYGESTNSEIVRCTTPDTATITFTDTSGIFGGGDYSVSIDGWVYNCLEMAKSAYYNPSTPLTRKTLGSIITGVNDPFASYPNYKEIIASGGIYYMAQDSTGLPPYALRELTTKMSSLIYQDGTFQRQAFTLIRSLKDTMRDIAGTEALTTSFVRIATLTISAILEEAKENNWVKDAYLNDAITIDNTTASITAPLVVVLYAPGNNITVNITLTLTD